MQDNDFEWYIKNFDQLYELYGDKYIAIKNQRIIGIYDSCAEGVRETSKKEEIGTFSFRIPSKKHVNYVDDIHLEQRIGKRHGKGKKKKRK